MKPKEAPPRDICPECMREIATVEDEGIHNTGECGCESSRALCWRPWNPGQACMSRSVYDRGNHP